MKGDTLHIWHSLSHRAIFKFFLQETPNRFDEWTTSVSTSWDTTEKKLIAPEHRSKPKLKVVFQPSIFFQVLLLLVSAKVVQKMLTYPSVITQNSILFHGFHPTGLQIWPSIKAKPWKPIFSSISMIFACQDI